MLLALDGSTTRLCEALIEGPVELLLVHQQQTVDVPAAVRQHLGGSAWLARVTTLHAGGQAMMDNLSYTRLDAVPGWFLEGLDQGQAPIGHLLQRLFVRRENVPGCAELSAQLWGHVGSPDERASRSYRVVTSDGPLMLIFEAWRGGMAVFADGKPA